MSDLAGLRVFVLEDEPIVAMMVEDMLFELQCDVIGPASSLSDAHAAIASEAFDVALLDVNINGDRSDPIAEALRDRGTPYVFATGYGASGVQPDGDAMILQKPFTLAQLREALGKAAAR